MSLTPEQRPKRLMSGTRVTGRMHIGHYWGALKNWLRFQEEYPCYFGVMDWHGLTTAYKTSEDLPAWVFDVYADLISLGLRPEKNPIFLQSLVPEHLELFMIFANLTPMGWLERVPTWKDAEAEAKQSDTHNVGRFFYPVLQAADIAIYSGQIVPVGQDQVAHLELCREIIRRFNHIYKAHLPEPKALLTETPAISGLDGRKMSKSYGNTVFLIEDSEKELKKKVNQMVTDPSRGRREDPGDPEKCSVYSFHKLYSQKDLSWVEEGCRTAGIGCGDCKNKLSQNIEATMGPAREIKHKLLNDKNHLQEVIHEGSQRARGEALKNLAAIREAMKWPRI